MLFLCCAVAIGQQPTKPELKLNSLFSDGMIFQQHASDPVFGVAGPFSDVTLTIQGKQYLTHADNLGAWQINLPIEDPGPAFSFDVSSGPDKVTVHDARIGEVWLASGQSNMEFEELQADDYELAKQQADPRVVMFTVKKTTSETPQRDVVGSWQASAANGIGHFSAVGLSFAREISNRLGVPVGIINSSWGGTPAETWISQEALQKDAATKPLFDKYLTDLKVYPARKTAYDVAMQMWINGRSGSENQGYLNGWILNAFNDSEWQDVAGGTDTRAILKRDYLGSIWYRKVVDVPDEWYGQPLKLDIGSISGYDSTYFNGVRIGLTNQTVADLDQERTYNVAPGLIHRGKNLIAIRVFNAEGAVGMRGPADEIKLSLQDDTSSVPLNGLWKFNIEQELDPETPRPHLPNGPGNPTSPAELYNGMISPLIPFRIKGAIWYQGESNVGNADLYGHLFGDLIRDWRSRWHQPTLPFYYVQLSNYLAKQTAPEESSWANLREAQAKALSIPNTGMAVTIDLGEVESIHPKNKREVGRRLALWALSFTYQFPTVYGSPAFRAMQVHGRSVDITFSNGALTTNDGKAPTGFAVAGADHKFYWATAKVEGSTVTLSAPEVTAPVSVRYAWGNNPNVNLVNRAGLPAAPFRTDDWPLTENP